MYDFNEAKSAAEVKKRVREIAFAAMVDAYTQLVGADNVSVIGNCELAVCLGTRTLADGTQGEVCFTTKPIAKDFDIRRADSGKIFKPFERIKAEEDYEDEVAKAKAKAEENARKKAAKIASDKKAREKKNE